MNGGKLWTSFQLNLPTVPITDLTIRNNDLIASTQGRAFWILDDLTPLHQYNKTLKKKDFHLFSPRVAYRTSGGSSESKTMGQNPPSGAIIIYHIANEFDKDSTLTLEILNQSETVIRTITNQSGQSAKTFGAPYSGAKIPAKQGINRYIWNLRVDDLVMVPDISFYGSYAGYRVGPGDYKIRLTIGETSMEQPLTVQHDPRIDIRDRDTQAHQKLMGDIYFKINDLHTAIVKARNIRSQIKKMNERIIEMGNMEELISTGKLAIKAIDNWEGQVVQTEMKTFQDVVNFINRLNAHMINLLETIDGSDPPLTQGQRDRYGDLSEEWHKHKKKLDSIINNEVTEFNRLYKKEGLPAVIILD